MLLREMIHYVTERNQISTFDFRFRFRLISGKGHHYDRLRIRKGKSYKLTVQKRKISLETWRYNKERQPKQTKIKFETLETLFWSIKRLVRGRRVRMLTDAVSLLRGASSGRA